MSGRKVQEKDGQTIYTTYSNSLSNKMGNSLLDVRGINHKYIVVGNKFDKKIHVNQIDPSNASVVEMTALGEHLKKQGIQTNLTASSGCMAMLSGIDVTRKIDFNQYMAEYSDMMGRGGSISATTLMPEADFTKLSVERYLFYLQHEAMENLIK